MANLDRRIRLIITSEGSYTKDGQYIPGAEILNASLWAEQADRGQTYNPDASGTLITRARSYMIRYLPALIEGVNGKPPVTPGQVLLFDEHGLHWQVQSYGEVGERRRFIEIECIAGTRIDSDDIKPPDV